MKSMSKPSLSVRLRQHVGALLVDNGFRALARAGGRLPAARPSRHGVEVLRDLSYSDLRMDHEAHRLDVYRPTRKGPPYPVVLYVHGGGFRILSKDTHWVMGLAFARRGYLVFNISYRLAPRHPFPSALEDCAAAYEWVARHAAAYGGDLSRFVLAGESAGANLVTSLALMASYPRPEPYAQRVFATGLQARAVIPQCGIHQVSDTARFGRRKRLRPWVGDRLWEVESAYLRGVAKDDPRRDLADPVVLLERGVRPERPLPAFFISVGTKDVLLDDTRRLAAAVERLGSRAEASYYEGELHAFQAMVFRKNARRCWLATYKFLDEVLAAPPATAGS
jgi:acetyl esterase